MVANGELTVHIHDLTPTMLSPSRLDGLQIGCLALAHCGVCMLNQGAQGQRGTAAQEVSKVVQCGGSEGNIAHLNVLDNNPHALRSVPRGLCGVILSPSIIRQSQGVFSS